MNNLSASIVAYKSDANILAQAIHSFLTNTRDSILFLIDNSPTNQLQYLAYDPRIIYIFNNKNLGFGAAHNIAIRRIIGKSKYHLVLNPDVYFDTGVMEKIYSFMEKNESIGQLMPKVLYPDGKLQPLCKLLPSPKTLILRRFFNFLRSTLEKENYHYEFKFSEYDKVMNVPFLSGCFMLLRVEALEKVGMFDERFFLYTEDTDLTRRIHRYYRTVFYPHAEIYHHHQRGSYKNFKLMLHNVFSAVQYFNKWGWRYDRERKLFNERAVMQFANQPA